MRFLAISESRDEHIADFNVYDRQTKTYYPMVSESVACEIAELLNEFQKE